MIPTKKTNNTQIPMISTSGMFVWSAMPIFLITCIYIMITDGLQADKKSFLNHILAELAMQEMRCYKE
jgi:hypothetical protein